MGKRVLLIALLLAALSVLSYARIINVPAEYATIQAGINASANGDTVLVAPGMYHENVSFFAHNITLASPYLITGDTANILSTIIDGDTAGAVVSIRQGQDSAAALIGFTIQNGRYYDGGGICCQMSNPLIKSNIIRNNTGWSGGGINCQHANPLIERNTILGNKARNGYGGGIYCNYSNPIIKGNIIRGCYSFA